MCAVGSGVSASTVRRRGFLVYMSSEGSGGVVGKLVDRFRRRGESARGIAVDDPDLTVLVRSDDDAVASSTVLEGVGFDDGAAAVLRHLLFVPSSAAEETAAAAAREGYVEGDPLSDDPEPDAGLVALAIARVQSVDARTVSQERSRCASLASRMGGRTVGWAVLGHRAAD